MLIANTGHAASVGTPTKSGRARFFSTEMRLILSPIRKMKSLEAVLHAAAHILIVKAVARCLTNSVAVNS